MATQMRLVALLTLQVWRWRQKQRRQQCSWQQRLARQTWWPTKQTKRRGVVLDRAACHSDQLLEALMVEAVGASAAVGRMRHSAAAAAAAAGRVNTMMCTRAPQ